MAKFKLEGLDEVLKALNGLEKLPQKCVNKSARNGAKIALTYARSKAPYFTGDLSNGIILKDEKTSKQGKKVYDVTFDNNPNFVKITKDNKRYYYPASQEYGFRTASGGKVEGLHFMRNSLENNKSIIEKTMVSVLADEIDKL